METETTDERLLEEELPQFAHAATLVLGDRHSGGYVEHLCPAGP